MGCSGNSLQHSQGTFPRQPFFTNDEGPAQRFFPLRANLLERWIYGNNYPANAERRPWILSSWPHRLARTQAFEGGFIVTAGWIDCFSRCDTNMCTFGNLTYIMVFPSDISVVPDYSDIRRMGKPGRIS